MNIVVIIQARMGSSRLQGKVLKPLGDHDVLTYNVKRCQEIKGVKEVVIATSNLTQDDPIVIWCEKHQIPYFRGSEEDVLDRYVQCARQYSPNYIMRVTSDCPYIDYEMASDMIALMEKERKEVVIVDGAIPRGLAVELISYEALLRIDKISKEPRHREHVTYYAYEFSEEFEILKYHVPENRIVPALRITLDTVEDYSMLSKVARYFNNPLISSVDVIEFLKEHPDISQINAHIEQKPVI